MSKLLFRGVDLTYKAAAGEVPALAGLTFEVAEGESLVILGPSGCGKSTTLQLASGLLQPTRGEVLVSGKPAPKPRLGTALILQNYGLLPWKTVYKNVELGLRIRRFPREQRRAAVTQALEMVGLADFARAYPSELSGGMQQRIALARALALQCDLLLMDEPLSALDALLREQVQDLLLELWQREGYTQVLVTHSIEEAVFLGQRILIFSERPSRVVAEILNPAAGTPGHRASAAFFEKCTEVRALLRGEGTPSPAAVAAADSVTVTDFASLADSASAVEGEEGCEA